jgi:predicted transcriptional regulator
MFKVKDIMNADIVAVAPDDTIDRAISLLVEHGVSGLPVADEDGCLVGVLSEFDLLELICDCHVEKDRVSDYMSSEVRKVDEDTSWVEVADIFRLNHMRRLPVTQGNKLVGIITRHDLMRAIQEARKRVRRELAANQQ